MGSSGWVVLGCVVVCVFGGEGERQGADEVLNVEKFSPPTSSVARWRPVSERAPRHHTTPPPVDHHRH